MGHLQALAFPSEINALPIASEQVTVNLRATAAHPAAPGVSVNAGVTFSWSAEGTTGVRQYGYQLEPVYTPLFCLKSIRRPLMRRAEGGPVNEG